MVDVDIAFAAAPFVVVGGGSVSFVVAIDVVESFARFFEFPPSLRLYVCLRKGEKVLYVFAFVCSKS